MSLYVERSMMDEEVMIMIAVAMTIGLAVFAVVFLYNKKPKADQ